MFSIFKRRTQSPQPLFFNTDIHCHVIPGIDDGAPDLETGAELVERMSALGFKRIFASPHITMTTFENTPETIAEPFSRLKEAVASRGTDVELHHWAENRIDDLMYRNLEENRMLTIPGNRVLIENSFMQEPWNLEKLVFDIQVKGLTPIMAHPERYTYYHGHRDHLAKLVDAGLALQVNMLSLAGYYGANEKKAAESLIDAGLVRYLGTDIHRFAHIESIEQYLASKDYTRHRAALENRILNDRI
ncbi:MAG: hypothetical protein K2M19_08870 [Muribaculaceae bacterium]|nr:hypothetical protein [Muribaculaceae bacterium]